LYLNTSAVFPNALNIQTGILHIEWIFSKKGPVLVEINPRLGGGMLGHAISQAFGADLYDQIIQISVGNDFSYPSKSSQVLTTETLYPTHSGRLKEIQGVEVAKTFPGIDSIHSEFQGEQIVSKPKDFRGALLHIISFGKTAEVSKNNNRAALNMIDLNYESTKEVL